MTSMNKVITVKQAREVIRDYTGHDYTYRTVLRWVTEGHIPAQQLPGHINTWVIVEDDLHRVLETGAIPLTIYDEEDMFQPQSRRTRVRDYLKEIYPAGATIAEIEKAVDDDWVYNDLGYYRKRGRIRAVVEGKDKRLKTYYWLEKEDKNDEPISAPAQKDGNIPPPELE